MAAGMSYSYSSQKQTTLLYVRYLDYICVSLCAMPMSPSRVSWSEGLQPVNAVLLPSDGSVPSNLSRLLEINFTHSCTVCSHVFVANTYGNMALVDLRNTGRCQFHHHGFFKQNFLPACLFWLMPSLVALLSFDFKSE